LVADQPTAMPRRHWRACGETRTVLVAVTGRRAHDSTPVRDDVAADLGVAGDDRVGLGLGVRNVRLREEGLSGV